MHGTLGLIGALFVLFVILGCGSEGESLGNGQSTRAATPTFVPTSVPTPIPTPIPSPEPTPKPPELAPTVIYVPVVADPPAPTPAPPLPEPAPTPDLETACAQWALTVGDRIYNYYKGGFPAETYEGLSVEASQVMFDMCVANATVADFCWAIEPWRYFFWDEDATQFTTTCLSGLFTG